MPFQTGTITTSGNDVSILDAPPPGKTRVITALRIQSENSTACSVVIKRGADPIGRVRCATDGMGFDRQYDKSTEWRTGQQISAVVSASGAIVGFTTEYREE